MKGKFFILILSFVSLLGESLYAEVICETPKETAILQLPDHSESKWKVISHYVNTQEGLIEAIPLNQTLKNWSELIAVQHVSSAKLDKAVCTLEKVAEYICHVILSSCPKDTFFWQIIENDNEGIIYEWIIHTPSKNISIEHEVARAFLTPTGLHRVGFTRKHAPMSSEERAKWIQLLRENSSVVSFQDAECMEGFSMVEKLQNSVSIGPLFRDWKRINQFAFETGYSLSAYIPPTPVEADVAECLEIITMPNVPLAPLSYFFEMEKSFVQEETPKKVRFHILEQSPTEIIYYYTHPKDDWHLNAVVRTFLTKHGYYSISYKKGLETRMQNGERRSLMKKLKTIRVKTPSKSIKVAL